MTKRAVWTSVLFWVVLVCTAVVVYVAFDRLG